MALTEENTFARNDLFPSWIANAFQKFLSGAAPALQLTILDATHVQVVAGAADKAAIVSVAGAWRWNEATVSRSHPGGAAGTWDIYAVAVKNKIDSTPAPGTDNTNRAFDLRIVEAGKTPTIEAGVVDLFRKIGELQWSGSAITRVDQTVPMAPTHAHRHATGQPDAIAPGDIGAAARTAMPLPFQSWGEIASTGAISSGTGNYTCAKSTPGVYLITFTGTQKPAQQPAVIATIGSVGAGLGVGTIRAQEQTVASFVVRTFTPAGEPEDYGFAFIAVSAS